MDLEQQLKALNGGEGGSGDGGEVPDPNPGGGDGGDEEAPDPTV